MVYGKFSNMLTSWIEKIRYIYIQGLISGEAKKAVISGLPFECFAFFR